MCNRCGWPAAIWLLLAVAAVAAPPDELKSARKLLLGGKYAEALETYNKFAEKDPVKAALGAARCHRAVGELDKAKAALTAALKAQPKASELIAELALIALDEGNYKLAAEHADNTISHDESQLAARWVQAELHRLRGQLDEAKAGYRWLVDYYNEHDDLDAESLHWIGLAAAQHARWNRLTDQFHFLVNELYTDALRLDPDFWPAHYETGRLFVEKYNEPDAAKALKAALALNPHAAELHAAIAKLAIQNFELSQARSALDRALAINPGLLAARQLEADVHFCNLDARLAAEVLRIALPLNPVSEETLGRLAAAYTVLDGKPGVDAGPRAKKITDEVNGRNPHAGAFYMALADSFDRMRRFDLAASSYRQATERMPELDTAQGQLGLMLMRLGQEQDAKKILDASFEADPFNLRVRNTLEVLDVLAGYETLETPHFIVKFDAKRDGVLGRYAAKVLEEAYPELCQQMGYAPRGKSLFEIFNDARGADGHSWFSTRMIGLPNIHTIGACAGKVVAMQSPGGRQKFNWARVLKHEFVHVINLEQTSFNVPHWFTEGLAVRHEQQPRSRLWQTVLVRRARAKQLFNLDTINLGFIRPHSSDDWTLAYCQAELYIEYMLERHGADAVAKMLTAYAGNLTTREAVRQSLGVDQARFEAGYSEHLQKIVAADPSAGNPAQRTAAELDEALKREPENPDVLAELALAHLNRRAFADARKLADQALKIQAKHQLAAYARARLHLQAREARAAADLLRKSLDEKAPESHLLALLAGLELKSEHYAEAARLCELGAKHHPSDPRWARLLAAAYLKLGDEAKLAGALEQLAGEDIDDLVVRKKLAELAIKRKEYPAAARWATEALHIDVADPEVHRMLGQALSNQSKHLPAAEEYAVALELAPQDHSLRLGLAQCYVDAGQDEKARTALEELLRHDPKYPGAELLLEGLTP